jgi:hypothetical protein
MYTKLMLPSFLRTLACCAVIFCLSVALAAQSSSSIESTAALPDAPKPQTQDRDAATLRNLPRNFLHDQAAIWTSPARLRAHDLEWLVPLGVVTGVAIATDHTTMTQVVSYDSGFNQANVNASNVLIGGFIASPALLYGLGHFQGSEHAQEAGILTGEAMLDGVVVEQGIKLMAWRERPAADNAHGHFFQSSTGLDSSFPSSHSLIAWAAASSIASEYHSPWIKLSVYSAAAGVSLTRVMGREHFPSDVLVGAASGWLIGHYVVHRHRRHASAAVVGSGSHLHP